MKKYLLFIIIAFSVTISNAQPLIWNGSVSSDYTNPANWEDFVAPNIIDGILQDALSIPWVSTNRYPTFNSITLGPGSITLTDCMITINGLTINAGGFLNIGSAAKCIITGNLVINSTSQSALVIQSSGMAQTGMLIYNDNLQSGSGFATVQLSITGGLDGSLPRFHYIVPPVQTISIGSTVTQVKSALGLANFNGDLLSFDESKATTTRELGWQYFDGYGSTTPFNYMDASRGYNIYTTSIDRIKFKGRLNSASHTFNLAYSVGKAGAGYNLVGNPYTSGYDLTGISGLVANYDNIANTIYYNNNGTYKYWNVLTNTGSSGYTNIVPPMQGFFVLVTASNLSLTLPKEAKTFSDPFTRSKGISTSKALMVKKVRLVLSEGMNSDETIVTLFNDATDSFNENYDGYKLFDKNTSTPVIYSIVGGIDYFMKAVVNPSSTPTIVPLKVTLRQPGTHSIIANDLDNLGGLKVKLKHGNAEMTLSSGFTYTFNSDAGTYDDFSLIFENIATGLEEKEFTSFKTWYNNNYLYVILPGNFQVGKCRLSIYDFSGKQVYLNNNLQIVPNQIAQIPIPLNKGFYITDFIISGIHYRSKVVVN